MKKALLLILTALPLAFSVADTIIPTTPGMTWNYSFTQETGEGIKFSNAEPDPDGRLRVSVAYRIAGPEKIDGQELLKFEMHRQGVITNSDFVIVDGRGILCVARQDKDGELVKLDPPQAMVKAPLTAGVAWNFDCNVKGAEVHHHYSVIGEEDVEVPAGKFRAFRIHGEQTLPTAISMDRWFVNGTGTVKDVTVFRGKEGEMLRRISIELVELPKFTTRPVVNPTPARKRISVSLAKNPIGDASTKFLSDVPKIYARWQGEGLRPDSKVRAVWIAENVGDLAAPNSTIDEATATATAHDSHGAFTLSRPEKGWAQGEYRVEFYLDDVLTDTVKMQISK